MTTLKLTPTELSKGVTLESNAKHTIYLLQVICARLIGLHFDTNKTFILPGGVANLTHIKSIYDDFGQSELLVIGHTDKSGEPSVNDPLSLRRAKSVAAFLQDDVDSWLEEYDKNLPSSRRWGQLEDHYMLNALEDITDRPAGEPLVKWFQKTRGLQVDNIAGPQTRTALITEYMGLDNTTLPSNVSIITYGCGENFPADSQQDSENNQEDRRVELFFFPKPDGVSPAPKGENATPDSQEYPQWLEAVTKTIDLDPNATPDVDEFEIHLLDFHGERMGNAQWCVVKDGNVIEQGIADDQGIATLLLENDLEEVELQWRSADFSGEASRYPHHKTLYLKAGTDEHFNPLQMLHNLGFNRHHETKENVLEFQSRYMSTHTGHLDDITDVLHDWHDTGNTPDLVNSDNQDAPEEEDEEDEAFFNHHVCSCADSPEVDQLG